MQSPLTRLLLVLAAGLLLSGCFVSQRPIFAREPPVRVFGDGGRYLIFEHRDGRYEPGEAIEMRLRTDGRYDMVDEQGRTTPVSFHAIAGGLYVAQALTSDAKYGYSVFRLNGDEALVYVPDCNDQDPAKLAAHGVERRGQYECALDRLTDPAALFAELELGQPTSKVVRQSAPTGNE